MDAPVYAKEQWALVDGLRMKTFTIVRIGEVQAYLDEVQVALANADFRIEPFDREHDGDVRSVLITTGWRSVTP